MRNIELRSLYYTDTTIVNIVWRVQKMSLARVVNVAVGENKKTIVDLQINENKLVTLIHNDHGSNCYYVDTVKQREDKTYVPIIDVIDDIETIARRIVSFLS